MNGLVFHLDITQLKKYLIIYIDMTLSLCLNTHKVKYGSNTFSA